MQQPATAAFRKASWEPCSAELFQTLNCFLPSPCFRLWAACWLWSYISHISTLRYSGPLPSFAPFHLILSSYTEGNFVHIFWEQPRDLRVVQGMLQSLNYRISSWGSGFFSPCPCSFPTFATECTAAGSHRRTWRSHPKQREESSCRGKGSFFSLLAEEVRSAVGTEQGQKSHLL